MRSMNLAILCAVQVSLLLAGQLKGETARRLVVGSGGSDCPAATFTSIQDAVNHASPGTEIHVCAGIYTEGVQITIPLTVTADPGATLMPQYLLPNATSLATGSPLAAILSVEGTSDVSVSGLVVDGGLASINECLPNLIGVLFQNSSGKIAHTIVRNTMLAPSLNGCQSGLGIFVQSGNGGQSKVTIAENRVGGYQKNGITANEVGTDADICDNTVTGLGPTSGAAQNGIQIGFGATGKVRGNFVTDHIWSPCAEDDECEFFSTGILVEQSDGIELADNVVGNNQDNIYVQGNNCEIERNQVYSSVVLNGIQVAGDNCHVEENRIAHSTLASIAFLGNDTLVRRNILVDAEVGILKFFGSLNSDIDRNRFIDIGDDVVDPRPVSLGATANPARD